MDTDRMYRVIVLGGIGLVRAATCTAVVTIVGCGASTTSIPGADAATDAVRADVAADAGSADVAPVIDVFPSELPTFVDAGRNDVQPDVLPFEGPAMLDAGTDAGSPPDVSPRDVFPSELPVRLDSGTDAQPDIPCFARETAIAFDC